MISESDSTLQNMLRNSQTFSLPPQNHSVSHSLETANQLSSPKINSDTHSTSLLYNLSVLKEKVHQIQSVINVIICSHQNPTESLPPSSTAIAAVHSLIQEVIMTASSMLFTCQQMSQVANSSLNNADVDDLQAHHRQILAGDQSTLTNFGNDHHNWYNTAAVYNNNNTSIEETTQSHLSSTASFDIIELDASDLLAKYTHYCQVCGKGFKRDANLRMHMRAHGDEYKTSAALSNPVKSREKDSNLSKTGRKYSCPQEGCRWNQKHAKFQPLKSLICVKNHYKRSHCPKMYVCKRCNRKQFSVLSDLRTHEKHCGDVKWLCSCGTTFSRKDKLMGHVALFVGHTPAINSNANPGKIVTAKQKNISLFPQNGSFLE